MLALEFLSWWYGKGWSLQAQIGRKRLIRTSHLFSLPILLRTLFAPWKRIITDPGPGLDAHVRAATDNLISRLIGFAVRLLVLFSAGVIMCLVFTLTIVEIIIWPLLPPAALFTLIKGFIG